MRGRPVSQPQFLTALNPEARIPAAHPLRAIKKFCDEALKRLSPLFEELYSEFGRASIPPEQLLKARVLMALYSVRSERRFCDQLQWNILWMWFLDREVEEGSWNHSVFAKNSERVLSREVAVLFFRAVYDQSREAGWASDDHFSADGTLIEAWASMKSFVRKDGGDAAKVDKGKDDDPGNPTISFKGETRRNDTHQSTSDPEAVLYRKGPGKEARLAYGFHALMENRHGLLAEFDVHNPIEVSEPAMALRQLQAREEDSGHTPRTAAADKGYHTKAFVQQCREMGVRPHVAQIDKRRVKGLDGRTTRSPGYKTSQRIRKQIEERFGWMKVVGGLRRTMHRGLDKVAAWGSFIAAACNLVLMSRLAHAPPSSA
jgi:transposase